MRLSRGLSYLLTVACCSSFLLAGLLTARLASAQVVETFAGAELWDAEGVNGAGIVMVRGTFEMPRTTFTAELNTDTLTLRYEGRFKDWTFGAQARGELFIAGLLTNYFVGGLLLPERGFYASYASALADGKTNLGDHWFHGSTGVRRWFFRASEATATELVLPASALVFEQRLGWTYWGIAPDPSWYEAHRVGRRRVRGFGIGAELGVDVREEPSAWGAPEDMRNRPERVIVTGRQWSAMGFEWQPGWRLQARQWAGWGHGEDDLTRARVGGMNPYVVPVPGLPWASFLASTYVAGELSQSYRIGRDVELGFTGNAVLIDDPRRAGAFDEYGALVGTSLFVDARVGRWQFNGAFGAAPDVGVLEIDLILSAYVDIGVSF